MKHINPRYTTKRSDISTHSVILPQSQFRRIRARSQYTPREERRELERLKLIDLKKNEEDANHTRSAILSTEVQDPHPILEKTEEVSTVYQLASKHSDEELDEIKKVNSLMNAARAMQERKYQIRMKKEKEESEVKHDRIFDEIQEDNRRTALKFYHDRAQTIKEKRKIGGQVLRAQIEERNVQKILEKERKDREGIELREQQQKVLEEEAKRKAEIRARNEAIKQDLIESLKAAKKRKKEEEEEEKKEVQKFLEFQAQKLHEDAKREKEKKLEKAFKQREIAKIQMNQKRAQDLQALRDEANANKIQKERNEMEKKQEIETKMKKKRMALDLVESLRESIRLKRSKEMKEKEQEEAEFQIMVDNENKMREKARKDFFEKLERDNAYRKELGATVNQINRERQSEWERKKKESGMSRLPEDDPYIQRIQKLTDEKLDQLRAEGVEEGFLEDIKKFRNSWK